MANTLGYYNPQFYANEALIWLRKALGMAGRVYMGYDSERKVFGKGDTINIRRPSSFVVNNAPSTAQDLTPDSVQMVLDQWKEVKFKLTDKELTLTQSVIIQEHIMPAAYAIADNIDQALCALYKDIPWNFDMAGTLTVSDMTGPQRVLFNNTVPMSDLHFMIDGTTQQQFLNLQAFTQYIGSGDTGTAAQLRGTLGNRFGFEIFANQNTPSHTAGTALLTTPITSGAQAAGATTLLISGTSGSGTLKKGDLISISGITQHFAVTADTVIGSTGATIPITPNVPAAGIAGSLAVTFDQNTSNVVQNIAFQKNAFAIAMAPLSEMGNELGAKIATIQDPVTGLSIRSRLYYVGNSSEVHVALDVLYGVKTLNPNLAVRCRK